MSELKARGREPDSDRVGSPSESARATVTDSESSAASGTELRIRTFMTSRLQRRLLGLSDSD